jgi:hypothetical protein
LRARVTTAQQLDVRQVSVQQQVAQALDDAIVLGKEPAIAADALPRQ